MKRNMKVQEQRVKKEKFQRQVFPDLQPLNQHQGDFIDALRYDTVIIGEGSAGVGKTMLACWWASKKLFYGDAKKVVLLRAYQPLAGRSIGLLPGTAEEKLMPYYQQMINYFEDFLGVAQTEIALKAGNISICSLETIRGRSWDNAII